MAQAASRPPRAPATASSTWEAPPHWHRTAIWRSTSLRVVPDGGAAGQRDRGYAGPWPAELSLASSIAPDTGQEHHADLPDGMVFASATAPRTTRSPSRSAGEAARLTRRPPLPYAPPRCRSRAPSNSSPDVKPSQGPNPSVRSRGARREALPPPRKRAPPERGSPLRLSSLSEQQARGSPMSIQQPSQPIRVVVPPRRRHRPGVHRQRGERPRSAPPPPTASPSSSPSGRSPEPPSRRRAAPCPRPPCSSAGRPTPSSSALPGPRAGTI